MAIPRTSPVPVPWEDLQRAKSYLAAQYGSQVWQEGQQRVLLIRVPHDDPDPVNDLEAAVEYLNPGDAMDLTHCLLIGERRMEGVYTQPVRDLMTQRVAADKAECHALRATMAKGTFKVFVAPKDPRRIGRLAVRLERESVHGLEDGDIDALADLLGPSFASGELDRVRAVYLIAERDDVRLDAAAFLPDLRHRFEDEDRRRRMVEEAERKHREVRYRKEEARRDLLRDLERRFGELARLEAPQRVARAPLRRMEADVAWQDPAPAPLAVEAAPPAPPVRGLMASALEAAGYDVLSEPPVEGHRVDLAAERDEAPCRIIVQFHERLTAAAAQAMLATAKALGADLVLGVAEAADPDAQRILVATKGRWVAPKDIQRMGL